MCYMMVVEYRCKLIKMYVLIELFLVFLMIFGLVFIGSFLVDKCFFGKLLVSMLE